MSGVLDSIKWLSHASFKIEHKGRIIYIDPWRVSDFEPADLILITHPHFDHFSEDDILNLSQDSTFLVLPEDVEISFLKDNKNVVRMTPGSSKDIGGFRIRAVPAYNIYKTHHPEANGWLGYILEIAGEAIYHAGDTDLIPEMEELDVDIALLPIGGTYTMNGVEAASAAERVGAKYVIPMHYGGIIDSGQSLEVFKESLSEDIKLRLG
jgi:L-ascorbate metabolism protein UlaG (beta-lactamase superfamily)